MATVLQKTRFWLHESKSIVTVQRIIRLKYRNCRSPTRVSPTHVFQSATGAGFAFMDDNARPHHTRAVEELLDNEDITGMEWPDYSPNLNLIEHVSGDVFRYDYMP
ncbi:hypothetical protein AVEN_25454-1 [Araneus ventricosus]|uniref:Tc1-like transposase DDE domain-containing protein n=1 Tax=Araneus ventricosus TaxID=182803 RepID=A0A4Y2KXD3_ARAVE|nr:hypothetical protein AVEN_25454-1 [Araneus ventricosus]